MRASRITTAIATLLLFASLAIACNPATPREDQDKDWLNAEDLVETSDRIVAARYLDEMVERVDTGETNSAGQPVEQDVLYRQFEITESFKGTAEVEDTIWMGFDPALKADLLDGSGESQPTRTDETYILFLKGRARPIEYPDEYGAVLWTGNGQPSFAELDGDELRFRSDIVYLELLEEDGIEVASEDSAAAFTLSLPELRAMTD